MLAATIDRWQAGGLFAVTATGAVACLVAAAATGRARWAIAAGWSTLLAASYIADLLGVRDDWSLRTVRTIGLRLLSWTFVVLPVLCWRDSVRARARARTVTETMKACEPRRDGEAT